MVLLSGALPIERRLARRDRHDSRERSRRRSTAWASQLLGDPRKIRCTVEQVDDRPAPSSRRRSSR